MSMKAGYAGDLTSYLFGSILYASNAHVLMIAALDVLVLGATILLFKELQAVSFEDEFTTVVGVPSGVVYAVLMTMVALTVVVLIKVVGVILAIALLSLPAASAKTWSKSLGRMMGWSTLISAFCTLTGLFASLWLGAQANIPPGPLIVLAGAAVFGGSVLAGPIRRRAGSQPIQVGGGRRSSLTLLAASARVRLVAERDDGGRRRQRRKPHGRRRSVRLALAPDGRSGHAHQSLVLVTPPAAIGSSRLTTRRTQSPVANELVAASTNRGYIPHDITLTS
jgi:hypothetical protein